MSERVACAEFAARFLLRQGMSHSLAMQLANAIINRDKGNTDERV